MITVQWCCQHHPTSTRPSRWQPLGLHKTLPFIVVTTRISFWGQEAQHFLWASPCSPLLLEVLKLAWPTLPHSQPQGVRSDQGEAFPLPTRTKASPAILGVLRLSWHCLQRLLLKFSLPSVKAKEPKWIFLHPFQHHIAPIWFQIPLWQLNWTHLQAANLAGSSMARWHHLVLLSIPNKEYWLTLETKQLKVRTHCCLVCYQMGQFWFICKEVLTDIWGKSNISCVKSTRIHCRWKESLRKNIPNRTKMYLALLPVTSKWTSL